MIVTPFGEVILKIHADSDKDLTEKIDFKIEIVELEKNWGICLWLMVGIRWMSS